MNQQIQNPTLLAAMARHGKTPSQESQSELFVQLAQATFLAANLGEIAGETRLVTTEQGGRIYLPLFTDWASLQAYTQREVTALPLPAAEAWDFALRHFDAVVINPANDALPLEKTTLEQLQTLAKGARQS